MTELTVRSFYPNYSISCDDILPFEDGTYEVWERTLLNIFIIKNHKIEYHIIYNISMKLRLITWKYEYLEQDGKQTYNVWRQQTDEDKYYLFLSKQC